MNNVRRHKIKMLIKMLRLHVNEIRSIANEEQKVVDSLKGSMKDAVIYEKSLIRLRALDDAAEGSEELITYLEIALDR